MRELDCPKTGEDAVREIEDERRNGVGRLEPRSSSSVKGLGEREVKGGCPRGLYVAIPSKQLSLFQ